MLSSWDNSVLTQLTIEHSPDRDIFGDLATQQIAFKKFQLWRSAVLPNRANPLVTTEYGVKQKEMSYVEKAAVFFGPFSLWLLQCCDF